MSTQCGRGSQTAEIHQCWLSGLFSKVTNSKSSCWIAFSFISNFWLCNSPDSLSCIKLSMRTSDCVCWCKVCLFHCVCMCVCMQQPALLLLCRHAFSSCSSSSVSVLLAFCHVPLCVTLPMGGGQREIECVRERERKRERERVTEEEWEAWVMSNGLWVGCERIGLL